MNEIKQRRGCSGCRALEWRFDLIGISHLNCRLDYPMIEGRPEVPCPKPKNYAEFDPLPFYVKPL